MAFAQSLPKGQFPVCCKLCLTDTNISWKCQECDILMCNRCKEIIHPNIKNARNHKVLDIKEVGQHTEDIRTIQCSKHTGKECELYCKSCDQLVCPVCIAKIHNGHNFSEISEVYHIHIERLKKGQNQLKNHLDLLTKQGNKIGEIKKNEKSKYTETKKKIQDHNKALKKAVDEYTDKLVKDLDEKWKTLTDSIEKAESQVITLQGNNIEKNQYIDKILNSNAHEKIFEESKKLEKSLTENLDLPDIEYISIPDFLPGEISHDNVGILQNISTDISIKVIKEFTTNISEVFYMSPSADSLWISNAKVLQKIKLRENMAKVHANIDMKIYGMAVTPDNDLLLNIGGSVLKMISGSTGEITDSVYSVHPLTITTVHVSSDYKIIVGASSHGELFPVTGRRVVVMMDKEGKNKITHEYDSNNQRLYTYPKRITTTHNGNICVVDKLSKDSSGRVVVSGMEGHIINIYTGLPDINTKDNPFRPASITTTPSDNIIIPDLDTRVLHIINNRGQYITHINGGDVGISDPYSIAFNTSGQVFIGCTTAVGSSDNAKLYEVKLTVC